MSDAPESGPGSQAFSLELGEDLARTRDWLHEFAASVIRPAGAEWDEREQTPWPVLEEAAKIGLYSLDFYTQQYLEPSGLGIPVVFEELFWGDAGIGMSLVGSTLAALSVVANGTPEQIGEWCPQMFGGPGDVKLGAFCSSEPEAGSDVAAIRTRAVYDAAAREWVLNGVKTWATNGGIANVHVVVASVDPSLGSRGQASFVVPPSTHRSGTRTVRARRPGPAQGAAGPGSGGRPRGGAGRDEDVRGLPAGCGGHGGGDRAGRSGVRRRVLGQPSPVRPADRAEPGRRLHAGRHGGSRRRGPPAGLAGGLDGAAGTGVPAG